METGGDRSIDELDVTFRVVAVGETITVGSFIEAVPKLDETVMRLVSVEGERLPDTFTITVIG